MFPRKHQRHGTFSLNQAERSDEAVPKLTESHEPASGALFQRLDRRLDLFEPLAPERKALAIDHQQRDCNTGLFRRVGVLVAASGRRRSRRSGRLLFGRVRLAAPRRSCVDVSSLPISRFREMVPESGKDRVRLARRSRIRRRVERDPSREGEKGGADSERFQLRDDDNVAVSIRKLARASNGRSGKRSAR